MSQKKKNLKIGVAQNGPYLMHGDPTIVRKKQITSEHGEPITWQTNEAKYIT